jgi:ketosteroid isomerase-like protein
VLTLLMAATAGIIAVQVVRHCGSGDGAVAVSCKNRRADDEIGGNVTIAEDHDAIRNLLGRYNHAIDAQQVDEWVSLFTDDGVFDRGGSVASGPDELRTVAESVKGPMRHVIANEVIDVDGDEANVRAYVFVFAGSPPVVRTSGTYDDQLRRVDGAWRFSRRTFRPDPS